MKAMVLARTAPAERNPLKPRDVPVPRPGKNEILVKVSACGVCRTDLDQVEGRIVSRLPIIPGHEIVGRVEKKGSQARRFGIGDRVGVGWISSACGSCGHCLSGNENLCPGFRATGRDANGGYAEYARVNENFAFRIPRAFSDQEAAPLLCAGSVGYRSLLLSGAGEGGRLGLTGFGACGHLILQMAIHKFPGIRVFVFARSRAQRDFAKKLGAHWTGRAESRPPERLDSVIDTTPAWAPAVEALRNLRPGGRLVINAIQKQDSGKTALLGLDYQRDLWMEKEIKSVANVARKDISGFLKLAAAVPIRPGTREYGLEQANQALEGLKKGNIRGALVLVP
jgi:propanol-preferring alcohol dehydrogenase